MNNKYYGFGILFLLAVLFTPLSAQNDTIEDYLKENKVWSVNRIITGGLAYRWMDILWFEGEEEKDGYVWKRYYTSRKEDRSDAKLSGWMRQEGRKVYMYSEGYDSCSNFYLLFDFGLEEGDTVEVSPMDRLVAHRVFDSVLEEGKGSRRCIKVRLTTVDPQGPEDGGGWDLWVEGIGSMKNGISISSLCFSGSVGQLLCVQDEEGYLYQNPDYPDCFIPGEEETRNETVHGNFPFCRVVNTAGGGEIAFLFSEPLSGWIQVFDMQGQCLLQERLSGEEHRIGKLAPGTYVYRVLDVNKVPLERGSGKFISL